ncbi:hypothetical protein AB0M47_08250 [Hamadaea sp. NPDC051192]|uniref:hypothetical protein n=1 Tax=Hamadaea sp. NPDC051192 TaxID=3154940 RepID=UPI00341AC28E
MSLDQKTIADITLLLAQRKKLQAVKVYLDHNPGVSLEAAKQAVEAIEAQPWSPQASALKANGQAMQAAQLVHKHTSLSMREAKRFVDGL